MKADIYDTASACHECQLHRPYKKILCYNHVKPGYAWNAVSIDVVGPLPVSIGKAKCIIVAIDGLTKWVKACAISNLYASTAAKFIIDQIIVFHGCPQFIKIVNGTNFSSGLFQKLLEYMHIHGVFTAPYHPSANGTVKRVNQTLANILCKISNTHVSKWPLFLSVSIFAYNISTHSSTGYSPFEMLYRRKPALPPVLYLLVSDQKAVSARQYLSRLTTALIKLHTNA